MLTDHATEALSHDECIEFLGHGRVGRVAVSVGALPAIYPVGYRLRGGDILIPAGETSRVRSALEGSVVAFEVDDFDPDEGTGCSVLAVGVAEVVTDDAATDNVTAPNQEPLGMFEEQPPGPAPGHLVRIHPEFVSGRRISQVIVAN